MGGSWAGGRLHVTQLGLRVPLWETKRSGLLPTLRQSGPGGCCQGVQGREDPAVPASGPPQLPAGTSGPSQSAGGKPEVQGRFLALGVGGWQGLMAQEARARTALLLQAAKGWGGLSHSDTYPKQGPAVSVLRGPLQLPSPNRTATLQHADVSVGKRGAAEVGERKFPGKPMRLRCLPRGGKGFSTCFLGLRGSESRTPRPSALVS